MVSGSACLYLSEEELANAGDGLGLSGRALYAPEILARVQL